MICTACGYEHDPKHTPEAALIRCEWAQERKAQGRAVPPASYRPDPPMWRDPDWLYEYERDMDQMEAYERSGRGRAA